MPASTLDPINAALRSALGKNEAGSLDEQLAGASKKALLAEVDFEPAGSYQSTVLDKLKNKYIVLKNSEAPQPSKPEEDMGADETLKLPKYELYPSEAVQLGWGKCDWSVGAGMINMGNTCYLNSTLQALFHVPALVNWLISDREHTSECPELGGSCIICSMRKTLQDSQQRNTTTIRPLLIYNKLRQVCRNMIPGRQEDAHEFLRYLVEAMEKSYLGRFKNHTELDSKVKETTPLNQILGGYLRSAVRCLKCGHVSTTFQHFQDLLLDIRKAQTLDEALEGYFAREKLDDDSYHCQACQKKVPATKQFSLERAPMVLCIQLKRFSVSNNKITKHITFRQRLDLTRYARHRPNVPHIYRLVALVTHMGPTVNCGHYTAVAQAPTGSFYQFDDSTVRVISHQAVFSTNAYIMLYELESSPCHQKSVTSSNSSPNKIAKSPLASPEATLNSSNSNNNNNTGKCVNGIGFTSDKVYGPELPPDRLDKAKTNGSTPIVPVSKQNGNKPSLESPVTSDENSDTEVNNSPAVTKSVNGKSVYASFGTLTPPPSPKKNVSNGSSTANGTENSNCKPKIDKSKKVPMQCEGASLSNSGRSSSSGSSGVHQTVPGKLVPYENESDESSCSSENNNMNNGGAEYRVSTKAAVGEWKVTATAAANGKSWTENRKSKKEGGGAVTELFKMSHSGYSAPVQSWNGTRSQLDKEVSSERREDRKRSMSDDSDQGRTKHPRTNYNSHKSNPGYNPVQEYLNSNWKNSSAQHSQRYRYFYNTGNRHKRNFHQKGGFHKNNRFRD